MGKTEMHLYVMDFDKIGSNDCIGWLNFSLKDQVRWFRWFMWFTGSINELQWFMWLKYTGHARAALAHRALKSQEVDRPMACVAAD